MPETITKNTIDATDFTIVKTYGVKQASVIDLPIAPYTTSDVIVKNPAPNEKRAADWDSRIAKRAEVAIQGLEAGDSVLTIGPNILSKRYKQQLESRAIAVFDESDI